eukprot:4536799-Pyramimonas_sp.AAC.1
MGTRHASQRQGDRDLLDRRGPHHHLCRWVCSPPPPPEAGGGGRPPPPPPPAPPPPPFLLPRA